MYDAAPVNIRPREVLKAYCKSINLTAAFDESKAEVGKRFMNDMAATFELFHSEGDLDAMECYWKIFDDYWLEEFCQEYGIIDDYDGQLVMSLFQNLKERECCEEE